MACHERGMALINVLLLLMVLLSLAHTLIEKVWQSSRQAADAAGRDRIFWAAQSAIEQARHRLAAEYRSSSGWQACLAGGRPGSYPAAPVWTLQSDDVDVDIFVRDNPDGDNDPLRDNDLKVFVLARAKGRNGAETMIEALCGLEPPGNVADGSRTGNGTDETVDPLDLPISTYVMKP